MQHSSCLDSNNSVLCAADLDKCLAAIPELRILNLNGCTDLQHVSLAAATKLEVLDISGCGGLQQVAASSLALRSIAAAGCSSLQVYLLDSHNTLDHRS